MADRPLLWIVIPCYNEQEVLPISAPMFLEKLQSLIAAGKIRNESRILFVDDGSGDATWEIISGLAQREEHYIGIRQSRNRGHQNAVLAGLMEARDRCDITISIDCDGQDDLDAMDQMVEEYLDGAEIVYGVRSDRRTDTRFKRTTAVGFYKFMNWLGVETVFNHADYRLVSARALKEFQDFREVNLFLRGMFPLVGFKTATVPYVRAERLAGETHYPFRKMLDLAVNGITSLSVRPIRKIAVTGAIILFLGLLGTLAAVIAAIAGATAAWVWILCALFVLSGIGILSLGIVGEYIGKNYMETKQRPRYIISDRTWAPYERRYIELDEIRRDDEK